MRWAALLKGVNVGGNRKLPMADLRAFIDGLGFADVKTLLASGNAVFDADETDGRTLETLLEREAEKSIGLKTDFLLRNAADLAKLIHANPFVDAARDHPNHLLFHFHRDPFPRSLIADLEKSYDGPERLTAVGRDLYVDYPKDVGHSKLPQAMTRARFPKLATARNWNTVLKLKALLD